MGLAAAMAWKRPKTTRAIRQLRTVDMWSLHGKPSRRPRGVQSPRPVRIAIGMHFRGPTKHIQSRCDSRAEIPQTAREVEESTPRPDSLCVDFSRSPLAGQVRTFE